MQCSRLLIEKTSSIGLPIGAVRVWLQLRCRVWQVSNLRAD